LDELLGFFRRPDDLELKFLLAAATLMLDVERGARWDTELFAGDLNVNARSASIASARRRSLATNWARL